MILGFAGALGVAIAFFFIGGFASARRGRAMLGSRSDRFSDEFLEKELPEAVRAVYWGLPGIAFVLLVGVFYWGLFAVATQFRGKIWIGYAIALLIGIGISQLQRILMRAGIERHLERRLTP